MKHIVNVTLCKENAVSDSVRYQLIIKQKDKTAGDYLNRTCNVCYCFEIPCQSDPCWLSIFDIFGTRESVLSLVHPISVVE